MSRPDMSLAVVGGLHSNTDGSNRQFEIAMCSPGEPVRLDVRAIFQRATSTGAVIRISFSGADPILPPERPRPEAPPAEDDFWPDYIPPD